MNRPLRVFLCHSSADKPAVRELYQKLRAEPWISPWLDEEDIFPGMDWNLEIQKAIRETDAILVCLSKSSITKEGYVQREIKTALDYADEKPDGTVYIIPVRLDECKPPERLAKWQYADYFEGQRERGFQRLLVSLKRRADSLGLTVGDLKSNEQKPFDPLKEMDKDIVSSKSFTIQKFTLPNGMEFMYIPAGEFIMGSEYGLANEKPSHKVSIPYDYWIGRFLVTNDQYNTYTSAKGISYIGIDRINKDNYPVHQLAWADANDFCDWLHEEYVSKLPDGMVLRLPLEMEWEKAARGVDGREYPWGNEFDGKKCNCFQGVRGGTTPVGLYSPDGDSPFGCADMAGNVWEWTNSFMRDYPYNELQAVKDGETRILRGGSFLSDKVAVRCSFRIGNSKRGNETHGFRLVIAPPLPK